MLQQAISLDQMMREADIANLKAFDHARWRPQLREPETIVEVAITGSATAETVDWTDELMIGMHGVCLERNVILLTERSTSPVDKASIINWIFASDIFRVVIRKDGTRKVIMSWQVPFTFAACCLLNGADPDHVRSDLLAKFEEVGIQIEFI